MVPYFGIVEDILDPKELGRVRVRVYGIHTQDTVLIPTKGLPWATVVQPTTSAANSGVGFTPKLLPGTLVMVIFLDPSELQSPLVIGTIPSELKEYVMSIDGKEIARGTSNVGFQDPTGSLPRKSYVGSNDLPKLARSTTQGSNTVSLGGDVNLATGTAQGAEPPQAIFYAIGDSHTVAIAKAGKFESLATVGRSAFSPDNDAAIKSIQENCIVVLSAGANDMSRSDKDSISKRVNDLIARLKEKKARIYYVMFGETDHPKYAEMRGKTRQAIRANLPSGIEILDIGKLSTQNGDGLHAHPSWYVEAAQKVKAAYTGSIPQRASVAVGSGPASKFTVSDEMVEELKKSEGFRSKPYLDGVGVWTIGYGSTYLLDGSKVTANTPEVTKEQATALMKIKLKKVYEDGVKRAVTTTITQSMYDALVSLCYNCGSGGLASFVAESGLNSNNFQRAADHFLNFRVNPGTVTEKGLRRRRQKEKDWFLKDGFPGEAKPAETTAPSQSFQAPRAASDSEEQASTDSTSITAGTANEFTRTSMQFSNSLFQMTEPGDIRDQHQYPHNQVRQSLRGHYEEWDDTPGNERINLQHASGSFQEWRPDGSRVVKVYKKDYTLIADDENIFVGGNVNVHISGNSNLYIQGNQRTHVAGNYFIQVDGDYEQVVGGTKSVQINGDDNRTVSGTVYESNKGHNIKSGGQVAIDGSSVEIESGSAASSGKSIVTLAAIKGIAMPEPVRVELSDAQWASITSSAQISVGPEALKGVGTVPQEGDVEFLTLTEAVDNPFIALETILQNILAAAKKGEWKRTGRNPNILNCFKAVGFNVAGDEVPWCAAFAGAVLKSAGIKALKTLSSHAYKGYGTSQNLSKPETWRLNDIVVFAYGEKGHVGFFRGYNKNGTVQILGGNQNSDVNSVGFLTSPPQGMPIVYVGRSWDVPKEYDKPLTSSGFASVVGVR